MHTNKCCLLAYRFLFQIPTLRDGYVQKLHTEQVVGIAVGYPAIVGQCAVVDAEQLPPDVVAVRL